jgi:predicted transcriptional regulator
VSRSDIVRALQVQQTWEHELETGDAPSEQDPSAVTAARAAARFANETVADIMTRDVATVEPDAPLERVAAIFVDRRIHRLPVVEAGRVVGMVTTLDIARLIADGRYIPE